MAGWRQLTDEDGHALVLLPILNDFRSELTRHRLPPRGGSTMSRGREHAREKERGRTRAREGGRERERIDASHAIDTVMNCAPAS